MTQFSKYELSILREALIEYQADVEIKKERGGDVPPRFIQQLNELGAKFDKIFEEEDTE